jgi:type I restriction enzyme S subunit
MSKRPALPHATIGSLVLPVQTWNPSREAAGRSIVYIDLSSVDNDKKVVTSSQHIAADQAPSRARQLVRAGDVLVSTVRPNLNGVARVPRELDALRANEDETSTPREFRP